MRRFAMALVAASLLFVPAMASAQATTAPAKVDTAGLSDAQIAEVAATAERLKAETPEDLRNARETVERMNQYVEIGKGLGSGIGAAAKELGVAVNDFAKTPVGKITMALIVFKVAGGQIIGILGGSIWFLVMIPLWIHYFNRICNPITVETEYDKESGKRIRTTKRGPEPGNGDIAAYRGIMLLVLIVISIAGFVMVF
jgi:hypothetical protein